MFFFDELESCDNWLYVESINEIRVVVNCEWWSSFKSSRKSFDNSCWISSFSIDCWLLESFRFFIWLRVVITRIVVSTSIWVIRFKKFLSRLKKVSSNMRRSVVDVEKWDTRFSSDLDSFSEQESRLLRWRSFHVCQFTTHSIIVRVHSTHRRRELFYSTIDDILRLHFARKYCDRSRLVVFSSLFANAMQIRLNDRIQTFVKRSFVIR
jgi:hypothetical protein